MERAKAVRVIKLSVLACCLGLCGCAVVEFVMPEGPPKQEKLLASYSQTVLKESSSADVLSMIHMPEYELLSQSKSVIASQGQKKKGHKLWFNMVAFDENELTAKRKYFFVVDEKAKVLFEPWAGLRFDCEMVLEKEVLNTPFANENARRIAILKQVQESVRADIKEVGSDNNKLDVCGMLVNQALEAVLAKLDSPAGSPALAVKLSELEGLKFSHMSFGKGKIQMVVVDDIVRVKTRLGSSVKKVIGAERYRCARCEYTYNPFLGDPGSGVKPGTSFENLPKDWACPGCGAGKNEKM